MDIKTELKSVKEHQQEIINKINLLEQQRQILMTEVLKLDGEARLLERMMQEEGKDRT